MPLKLHIFHNIAAKLKGFLTTFPSDAPPVPFMANALEMIMQCFMTFFILKKSVSDADSQYKLIKIDVEDAAKYKPLSQVKLPTSAQAVLSSGEFSDQQKESVKKGFVSLTKNIVLKLQERIPLGSSIVRNASSISPINMATDGENSSTKFANLVNLLQKHKHVTGNAADAAKEQYDTFLETDIKQHINKFRNLDCSKTRLDEFLGTCWCR